MGVPPAPSRLSASPSSSRRCRSGSISASVNRWSTCSVSASSRPGWPTWWGSTSTTAAGVYYTSLLINVGCHTDAHEQAKWFGDDIDLKADKYLYEPRTFREVVAALRRFGSGHPPLQRVQLGAEFALHGRQDLEGMIVRHASLAGRVGRGARPLRGDLRRAPRRVRAVGRQGLAGGAQWRRRPDRVEDRRDLRVRRGHEPSAWSRARPARSCVDGRAPSSTPPWPSCSPPVRTTSSADLDGLGTWGAVIDAEPALRVVLTEDQLDAALMAIANFVDLKSPFTLGHSSAVADLAAGAATGLGVEPEEVKILWRAGLVHGLGRLGVSNQIWDRARALGTRRLGTGSSPALPHRSDAEAVRRAGPARRTGGAAPRAPRRLRVSGGTGRPGDRPDRPHPRA